MVNDRGVANDGSGSDSTPASEVAAEIRAHGGQAVASDHDIASWDGARSAIALAIETFGDLDIVVNNAGILRDAMIVNMSEADFDEVVRVHMKGHVAPTRWAAAHWREQHKLGSRRPRNLVHTSSTSGIYANPGQSNYGSAKSGIVTFSQIAAKELARYGVGLELRRSGSADSAHDVVAGPPRDHGGAGGGLRRLGGGQCLTGRRLPLWRRVPVHAVTRSTCRVARCVGSSRGRWPASRSSIRRGGRSMRLHSAMSAFQPRSRS